MESLDMTQTMVNPYTSITYTLSTQYNPRKALYETIIGFYMNDGSGHYITIPIQRYKMRTEALRGHNTWLYTLRQEEFAFRNIDTAELHIFNQGGILDSGNDRED